MSKVFQQKHQSGWLWWKRIYYTYWEYDGSSVRQLPIHGQEFLDSMEKGK